MKDLKLKAITALLLMTVLCALGNYLLVRRAILLIAEREQVHNERKLDSLSELNDLLEAESDDAMESGSVDLVTFLSHKRAIVYLRSGWDLVRGSIQTIGGIKICRK